MACMTEPAPRAHPQYDSQVWHVDFRLHIDLDTPTETYIIAELVKKKLVGEHSTWLNQSRYAFTPTEVEVPYAGKCWHNYMLQQLDLIRGWIMADHLNAAQQHRDTEIRPEMGVSYPYAAPPAG